MQYFRSVILKKCYFLGINSKKIAINLELTLKKLYLCGVIQLRYD